jgi:hypothetical protein
VSEQALIQAEKLLEAIRGLLERLEDERRRVDEARARVEDTNRRFSEAVERARARQAAGEQPRIDGTGPSLTPPGVPATTDDMRESIHRSIQRETAICDACDALIALAGAPELTTHVAETALALRKFRIYQVAFQLDELEDTALPDFAPAPAEAMHDEPIRHRWKMDMAAQVTEWARDRMERSKNRQDQAMAESDRLLRRVMDAAERLLAAARETA